MADEIPPGSLEGAPLPVPVVSGDPETEALLARHAAGEKLDARSYGRIGAYHSRLAKAGRRPARPSRPPAPVRTPPPDAGLATGPADPYAEPLAGDGDCDAGPPVDSALVRRTTESLLRACDGIAQNYIRAEAAKAGASPGGAARMAEAVAMGDENRALMVDTSPEVFASLGVDPKNYPIGIFLAGFGAWLAGIGTAVSEIKSAAASRPPPPPPAPSNS